MYQTDQYEGIIAETVTIHGFHGDVINAYQARPLGAGPFAGIALAHPCQVGMSGTAKLLCGWRAMDTW
jgi:hypothetical protein